ncbi:hypothetical protein H072_4350 [Dactylellina haptotyla CBS 200.50]|uniref:Uncharacterized protein n=1 Tax=Dactylellina haptotyla (strain CBS 200.50) TaxID=1284197 RepID=S8AFT7_DACHA|nr:hypothetical protein H072_4350 [Dactylellina haptotyla CBS 200.50]
MRPASLVLLIATIASGLNAMPTPQAAVPPPVTTPPIPLESKEAEIMSVIFAINEWARSVGVPVDRAHPLFPSLRGCKYDGIIWEKLRDLIGKPCEADPTPTGSAPPTSSTGSTPTVRPTIQPTSSGRP